MGSVKLKIKRLPETDEWRVEWWEDGMYDEDKTYYTDDYEDARGTMRLIAEQAHREGYQVEAFG